MILRTITSLITALILAGYEVAPQVPKAKQNYPAIIKDSADRRAKAEREWRRMLDSYTVQQTPPDFYPITNTPRSLLGVSNGIKLLNGKPEPGTERLALREAMRAFMDRWRELLAIDPAAISLISADLSGDTERLTYSQANYAYPLAGNFGEIVAVLTRDGRLIQLDDRFIPIVDLPLKPSIERDIAAKKIVGRTFSYKDIAGREQRTQIGEATEVNVKRLVILPIEKGDAVEVRLVWEIIAGRSLSWTVYIDAVTGEDVRVVQNFQT
jgi:PAS domain-containing protein